MKLTKTLFTLLLTGFIFSCSSKPPKDMEPVNFLDLISTSIIKVNELKDNKEALRSYMEERGKKDTLSAFYKDDEIIIHDRKRDSSENALIYSNGDGTIIINRDVYVTKSRKGDFLFSLDNQHWYAQENNHEKDIENIDYLFDIESYLSSDLKTLTIEFSWEAVMSQHPTTIGIGKRELINLGEGMIFDHSDTKLININMKKITLFIPRGTIIKSEFNVLGNLISSSVIGNEITIKAEKDLFLYTGDKRMGLSFDNEHWNVSIFSFKIKSTNVMLTTNESNILIKNSMEVLYKN